MLDHQLDQLLSSRDEVQFHRMLAVFRPDLTPNRAIVEGERWLKRRAVRRTDFEPTDPKRGSSRKGSPLTWADRRIIKWAFTPSAETRAGAEVTVSYVARILARTMKEVDDCLNTKNGIKGFEL